MPGPELTDRPEELPSKTYQVRVPQSEHAFYVTITDHFVRGKRRPFEIFINSKNIDAFHWVMTVCRIMSAVFRTGEGRFLISELKAVFHPDSAHLYWKGDKQLNIINEIGECLERHIEWLEEKNHGIDATPA